MPNKNKGKNKPNVFCERCQRVGHLAEDCYSRMCHYCKKTGHDLRECRTYQKDKQFVIDAAKQLFRKASLRPCDPEGQPSTSNASSSISTEISSLSTVGAYRNYLTCLYRDIIEISAPELKGKKAKMIVDMNCPITMIKIGKIQDDVTAAKEVVTLEEPFGARVKTICLICLSIHVNNKTVLHSCRVVADDFYIETDGVLGGDFINKAKIMPGKYVELAGIQVPFIPNEFVRGIFRVDELIDVSSADSDSETLTGSSS